MKRKPETKRTSLELQKKKRHALTYQGETEDVPAKGALFEGKKGANRQVD
jgi:hypothetical protein